jgi:hypothetical protein
MSASTLPATAPASRIATNSAPVLRMILPTNAA